MRPKSRYALPLRYHVSLSARHGASSCSARAVSSPLIFCNDHPYAEFSKMLPCIGKLMPGTSAADVAMALRAAGGFLAAAQAEKALHPSPYIPTRPSLQDCLLIQAITSRVSAPWISKGSMT